MTLRTTEKRLVDGVGTWKPRHIWVQVQVEQCMHAEAYIHDTPIHEQCMHATMHVIKAYCAC